MFLLRLTPLLATLALSGVLYAGDAESAAELLNKGQSGDALQLLDKALAKAPRDARLRLLRGNALAGLGRTQEAIQV
jgi:Flp pilus assembly protein TadD